MKELKMFIDGRFIEHESGKWIKVLNPSTEEVISLMPDGTVEDAKRAIDAAEKAQIIVAPQAQRQRDRVQTEPAVAQEAHRSRHQKREDRQHVQPHKIPVIPRHE